MKINPFSIALAILDVCAGFYAIAKEKDWRMGIVWFCYAVATIFLGMSANKLK